MEHSVTILDLLENFLGDLSDQRIDALQASNIAELAERVTEFYDNWSPPAGDELRMYAGGWIAGNFVAPDALQYLLNTLIYYPQTIIHDPIADWFFPRRLQLQSPKGVWSRGKQMQVQGSEVALLAGNGYYQFTADSERTRAQLKLVIPVFRMLGDLLRSGVVVPVPQWWIVEERQTQLLSAVRHDVRDREFVDAVRSPVDEPAPRSDQVRGAAVSPSGGWATGEEDRGDSQDVSYFLNKTLAIADATNSLYVPSAATDANLFTVRGRRVSEELRRQGVELLIAPALVNADLPFLGNLDAATILAIRRDESAFADWRAELRTAVRSVASVPGDGEAFRTEARGVLRDALLPRAHEIERTLSASGALRGKAKDLLVEMSLGGATLGITSDLGHQPFDRAAFAAVSMSAVARWFLSPLLRESPTGSKAVLATLIKKT